MVPTITTTREKRARILLAEAPPANGQTRSDDGRPLPALPLFQRNLAAIDVTALFLRRSTRPCATVQWLLCHRCGSFDPPLSERLAPGVRLSPGADTRTRGQSTQALLSPSGVQLIEWPAIRLPSPVRQRSAPRCCRRQQHRYLGMLKHLHRHTTEQENPGDILVVAQGDVHLFPFPALLGICYDDNQAIHLAPLCPGFIRCEGFPAIALVTGACQSRLVR